MANPISYSSVLSSAQTLIAEVAAWIKEERKKLQGYELKADYSLVTKIDVGSEERLKKGLSKVLPEAEFLAEENSRVKPDAEFYWVIDPIDGTTNFVHGLPVYCISVALFQNDLPVIGIIHEITSGEVFTACKDIEGAFLNGIEMHVSKVETLRSSLLATGFPSLDFSLLEPYVDLLKVLMRKTHGIRRLGSAAMDLAFVACGRFEGFYEYGLSPWDVAAGVYLIEKAGGKVTDFKGGNDFIFGKEIISSNSLIHEELQALFKNINN